MNPGHALDTANLLRRIDEIRRDLAASLGSKDVQQRTAELLDEIRDQLLTALESEQRLLSVIEATPIILWAVDLDGIVTLSEGKGLEGLGKAPGEMVGQSVFEICKDDPEAADSIRRGLRGDEFETRSVALGRAWHSRYTPRRDDQGRVIGVLGMSMDVTEQWQTDQELRKSEERHRSFVRNSLEAIWCLEYDPPVPIDGPRERTARSLVDIAVFAECNDACARSFGLARAEELIGKRLSDVAVGRGERYLGLLDEFLRCSLRLTEWESVTTDPDGSERHHLTSLDGVLEDDRLVRIWATERDVTEKRLAEGQLERLSMAIEQAAEVIIITDTDGHITYVNPAWERASGYTREESLGRRPNIVKSELMNESVYDELWKVILSGQTWSGRLVNKRKNGTVYTEDSTITPVRSADGEIVAFVAVNRDITTELELQVQLAQAQRMESIGRLAGGIAHDFNNLLTVILGCSDLISERLSASDPMRRDAEEISSAARLAKALTRQLLAFSRRQILRPKDVDLNAILEDLGSLLERALGEDIHLEMDLEAALGLVHIDPAQIEQVVLNLAVNSRDAMPHGGTLGIETRNAEIDEATSRRAVDVEPGPYVRLVVRDSGCGMDTRTLARAFEPFFTTKEEGKGTGLGLATVHGIVRQSGGHLDVESAPDQGTSITIFLPRSAAGPLREPAAQHVGEIPRGTESILVVEDNDAVRRLTVRALRRLGYRVVEAACGPDALEVLERQDSIDLLLTDVVMPGQSGPQLAAEVEARHPETRILFMSGHADHTLVEQGGQGRLTEFLQKPFLPEALALKVRQLLDDSD